MARISTKSPSTRRVSKCQICAHLRNNFPERGRERLRRGEVFGERPRRRMDEGSTVVVLCQFDDPPGGVVEEMPIEGQGHGGSLLVVASFSLHPLLQGPTTSLRKNKEVAQIHLPPFPSPSYLCFFCLARILRSCRHALCHQTRNSDRLVARRRAGYRVKNFQAYMRVAA